MVTLYWIFEYIKVALGYIFLMFLFPSVVFNRRLKRKSMTYRFSFCATVSIMIINFLVMFFGLLHILHDWIIILVMYGIFIWCMKKKYKINLKKMKYFYQIVLGVYGLKSFIYHLLQKFKKNCKKNFSKWWRKFCICPMQYIILFVVTAFGMVYFSYGSFQKFSYGISDMYTHHQWIYEMTEGRIFSDGIYPQAFHCFIYCMHVLFGIRIYSCVLFLSSIHMAVILLSAYFLLRELFHWKYTPIFILAAFLILNVYSKDMVLSMSRLQWSLPQEFGWYTVFLCALYLVRYLKISHRIVSGERMSHFCWDENLFLAACSLSAAIAIHFFTAFAVIIIFISIAIIALKKLFMREHFVPLIFASLCGALIAAAPMAAGYGSGIPFQQSIYLKFDAFYQGGQSEESIQNKDNNEIGQELDYPNQTENSIRMESVINLKRIPLMKDIINLKNRLQNMIVQIYEYGYAELYGNIQSLFIAVLSGCIFVLWLIFHIIDLIFLHIFPKIKAMIKLKINKKNEREKAENLQDNTKINMIIGYFDAYIPFVAASFLFIVVYTLPKLGILQITQPERVCAVIQILVLAVAAVPIDMFFSLLAQFCKDGILQVLSIFCTAGIYIAAVKFDYFHGYLYYNLSRYDSVVMVTESIINTLPKYSYTIVSPTEELYQTIQKGRHEELITFVKKSKEKNYTIPTEYVFVYVEKKPIVYPQMHFFSGPSWLAEEKYSQLDGYDRSVSQYPEINASEIAEENLQENITSYQETHEIYTDIEKRTVIESMAYDWCQHFSKVYPFEMDIYYEDDDFVCYYFRQGPGTLYDLAIG